MKRTVVLEYKENDASIDISGSDFLRMREKTISGGKNVEIFKNIILPGACFSICF